MISEASSVFCTERHPQSDVRCPEWWADINILITPFIVFRPDLEFSTITRFFPGLINEAFQNYVPKSMPNTWASERTRIVNMSKKIFIFIIPLIYTYKFIPILHYTKYIISTSKSDWMCSNKCHGLKNDIKQWIVNEPMSSRQPFKILIKNFYPHAIIAIIIIHF